MELADGIREGDWQRILRCWHFFLPLFKANNRTNYSIEAFTLLAQHDFIYSERLKQQLIYERTIKHMDILVKTFSVTCSWNI